MEVWGLSGLFAGSFLAATILPFSSEVFFLALLAAGYSPAACFLTATAGNSLGGFTNLLLGRYSRRFFDKKRKTLRGEHILQRFGAWTALLSWVPFIGDPLLIAAGFYRTPFWFTAALMALGKASRYAILLYLFVTAAK